MKKLLSIVLVLALVFSLAVPSFAQTADGQSTSLQSGWGSSTNNSTPSGYTSSWFARVLYWLKELETTSNSMLSSLTEIYGEVSSIDTNTSSIRSDVSSMELDVNNIYANSATVLLRLNSLISDTGSIDTSLDSIESDIDTINFYLTKTLDAHLNHFSGYLSLIKDDVSMLQQVIASEQDLAMREAQKDNFGSVSSGFLNGGSSFHSLGATDFMAFAALSNSFSMVFGVEGLDNNVTGFSSYFSDSYNLVVREVPFLSWFTEEIKNSLVSVPSTFSRDDPYEVVTHYYQDSQDFYKSFLGGDING